LVILKCFIDLDGILANFHKSAFKLHGSVEPEIYPQDGWIPTCLNISEKDFWSKIDYDFWCNLEVMPDAQKILDTIHRFIPIEHCALLTSPSKHAPAASGKMFWIQKNFPQFERRFLIGACKEMCANRDTILIDDLEKNIDGFIGEGGHGILLPRPWNKERALANHAVAVLEKRLEYICR
jgi:5'(3')-deoxyribonucleotidase